jgi:hypothetical protein
VATREPPARSSHASSGEGVTCYEDPPFSPSSPLPSLSLSHSSYFWPLGVLAPSRTRLQLTVAQSSPWPRSVIYLHEGSPVLLLAHTRVNQFCCRIFRMFSR